MKVKPEAISQFVRLKRNLFLGRPKKRAAMTLRQKNREAKNDKLMREAMETIQDSLARLVPQKRWMGELYENQNIFKRPASRTIWLRFIMASFYYIRDRKYAQHKHIWPCSVPLFQRRAVLQNGKSVRNNAEKLVLWVVVVYHRWPTFTDFYCHRTGKSMNTLFHALAQLPLHWNSVYFDLVTVINHSNYTLRHYHCAFPLRTTFPETAILFRPVWSKHKLIC